MNVEDHTAPISELEFGFALARLVALVDGLADAPFHCQCGRYFRVGITDELRQVLDLIKRATRERTGEDIVADTSRFALLEVD